jgi:uncharacterized membrane protein
MLKTVKTLTMLAVLTATLIPAFAEESLRIDPNQRYAVTGVAAGDVLNIRQDPSVAATIIGSYAPNATDILVSGVTSSIDGSEWVEVIDAARGKTGFVRAKFLAPSNAAQEPETDYPIACIGTEPFWGIRISGEKATINDVDGESTATAGQWMLTGPNSRSFFVPLAPKGSVSVVDAGAQCSDGMSDNLYPWHGILITPSGYAFAGCCARSGG